MRLWIFSDLHVDPSSIFMPPWPDADLCVVAGDVLTRGPENSLQWLERMCAPRRMPVVFVAGNHEYYGGRFGFDLSRERARDLRLPGTHFLDDSVAVIGGVRFIGCTLWTDFELNGSTAKDVAWAMRDVGGMLADFVAIQDFSDSTGKLTTQRTKTMHERSRTFLKETLATPFDGPTVVVTHHAPHRGSLHSRWRDSTLNPGFVSDLEGLILAGQPDLWVHGHVHDSFDYMVGRTRVVCNPKGYGDENLAFDPSLVVEV